MKDHHYLSKAERAKAKGVEVGDLLNDLLKRDIEMIEAASLLDARACENTKRDLSR
jgi:hypothetical protein